MKRIMLLLVVAAFTLTAAFTAYGTPTIAKNTGKKCAECHQKNDSGNGGGGPHDNGPFDGRNK